MGMPRECRRVFFSGRVQGVGFRFTCQALARDFDVAGYVRNLRDGRVELVAEGDPSELDHFLTAIQREMSFYIRDVATEAGSPGANPLTGFSIRH
jgi:acylphosphatase